MSALKNGFREAWQIAKYPSLALLCVYFSFAVWVFAYWLATNVFAN